MGTYVKKIENRKLSMIEMPINFMGISSKKIGCMAKNAIDRVVDLCYNKTIERQGTERHEKWRVKK